MVIACAQAAIFVACIPVNRAFKVIFGLIGMIVFGMAYFGVMAAVSGIVVGGFSIGYRTGHFWLIAAILLIITCFLVGLFFVMSVALIMPLASNRALPVRLFITAAWVLTGATTLIDSAVEDHHPPVILWHVLFNIIFAAALFVAVSERDRLGRRVLRAVPQSTARQAFSFFFFICTRASRACGPCWSPH